MRGSRVVIMNHSDSRQNGFSDSRRDNDGFHHNSRGNNFDNRISSDNGGVPNYANRGSRSGNRGALVARTTGELSGESVVLTEVVEETVEEEMVEVETITLVTKTFRSKQDFETFAGGVVIVIMKITY
ncbi:hypothetical protein DPMN_001212 [Dreissena polymorpha]|uniref:Uncharacterized protein n=1 Tax=Dreissena polymorpha TaxID=45954 RepID=A0A9D4RQN6_DREPO|nr:hypothetical protein DPMN_001212 [Dreissena polymorpha]